MCIRDRSWAALACCSALAASAAATRAASSARAASCLLYTSLEPLEQGAHLVQHFGVGDDNVEVVGEETVLYPGDKSIVLADTEVLDEVRSLFKGL